jgi:hypothetical protein
MGWLVRGTESKRRFCGGPKTPRSPTPLEFASAVCVFELLVQTLNLGLSFDSALERKVKKVCYLEK